MIELGPIAARWTDLLRLVVLPVLVWAAIKDIRIRRVPDQIWLPIAGLGILVLLADTVHYWGQGVVWTQFLVGTVVSIGLIIPLAYGFWLIGGFGGADAKGLMVLAVLFPVFPRYEIGEAVYPIVTTDIGAFGLTILTNAVLIGAVYPVALVVQNALNGDFERRMAIGRQEDWDSLSNSHGQLLESAEGPVRRGLDLDALRMYLRWRGVSLEDIRNRSEELRDPETIPDNPNPPTDGAIADGGDYDDPWGAEQFLDSIKGNAYGTDPETLRQGLDVIVQKDRIWVSPGMPFFVPIIVGLIVALTYGDILYGIAELSGIL